MTGRRFCIDCPEFRRKLSQVTIKSRFAGFVISWKVTSTQNGHWSARLPPNWSAVVPEWSIGAPGSFQNSIKNNRNPNKNSGNLQISKFAKTRPVGSKSTDIHGYWISMDDTWISMIVLWVGVLFVCEFRLTCFVISCQYFVGCFCILLTGVPLTIWGSSGVNERSF